MLTKGGRGLVGGWEGGREKMEELVVGWMLVGRSGKIVKWDLKALKRRMELEEVVTFKITFTTRMRVHHKSYTVTVVCMRERERL